MIKRKPARAQAIRCAPDALERLRVGETVMAVFDDLSQRGEIDMAYRTFAHWMKRFSEKPETLPATEKPSNAQGHRRAVNRAPSRDSPVRSNKSTRKPGEPFIGSIGIAPDAWKPSSEPPDLRKLIGDDYDEL
jgi:hypothetical protein